MAKEKSEAAKARDIMHPGTQCVGENETILDAAKMMRDLKVGAVPICGEDDRLKGMITDRDIVIQCCAEGRDLSKTKAGELSGPVFWVDADATVVEALNVMEQHQIKRVPVIENHRLVGIISEHDLARNLSDEKLAEFVEKVYAPA